MFSILIAAIPFVSTPELPGLSALPPITTSITQPEPLAASLMRRQFRPGQLSLSNQRMIIGDQSFTGDAVDAAFNASTGIGYSFDQRTQSSGVGMEFGVNAIDHSAVGSGSGLTSSVNTTIVELLVGVRYTQALGVSGFYAYGAGGVDLATIDVRATVSGSGLNIAANKTESGLAGYIRAGIAYQLSNQFSLGLELRRTFGLEAGGLDFDYIQAAVTLGWGS